MLTNRFEFAEDLSAFALRALRDVEEDEEITISYGEVRRYVMLLYGHMLTPLPAGG